MKVGDLILVAENRLDKDFCEHCIEKFKKDENRYQGVLGIGRDVRLDIKQSMDLIISGRTDWKEEDDVFYNTFKDVLETYKKCMYPLSNICLGGNTEDTGYQIQETAPGGFYEWHTDNGINFMNGTSPVRKISMSLLLNHESEFDGGDLELCEEGKVAPLKQGHAIFFASFLNHRVKPVTRGTRKSLVMWFGGTPFK